MVKLSKSQLVHHLAKKSFRECDLDNDGELPCLPYPGAAPRLGIAGTPVPCKVGRSHRRRLSRQLASLPCPVQAPLTPRSCTWGCCLCMTNSTSRCLCTCRWACCVRRACPAAAAAAKLAHAQLLAVTTKASQKSPLPVHTCNAFPSQGCRPASPSLLPTSRPTTTRFRSCCASMMLMARASWTLRCGVAGLGSIQVGLGAAVPDCCWSAATGCAALAAGAAQHARRQR